MITDENSLKRAESRGDEVCLLSDHELVNRAGLEQHPFERDAATAELQRRSADVMIGLTNKIRWLTVAILGFTVVLVVVEVWSAVGR